MPNVICADIRKDLWALVDGDLDEARRRAVEAHCAACPACARELDLRRRVWLALDCDAVPAPRDLTQRILNAAALERPAARRRLGLRWIAAAAAAILLALLIALRPQPQEPPGSPAVAAEQTYLETELVSLEHVSDIELLVYADYLETLVDGDPTWDGVIVVP